MARSVVSVKIDTRKLEKSIERAKDAAERGMNDVIDDLIRVSSEIAPHDKGILEKSWSKDVSWKGKRIEGEASYSVSESGSGGRYNYALAMHEKDYNLGPGSSAKPGTGGMSGKHYDVGNKYLTRPLEGETETYKEHVADEIRRELTKG